MKIDQIPFYARILLAIGVGVALSVSLDNIAIGIGVATVFIAGIVARENKSAKSPEQNDEQ